MENELKYLLPLHFNASALVGWTMTKIMQGYVDDAIVKMWKKNEKPHFSVTINTEQGPLFFESTQIDEEQFTALSKGASDFDGTYYTLPKDIRIRNESGEFTLTYKHVIDGNLVELEDEITEDFFNSAQPVARDFVYKDRYTLKIQDEDWFIDFLRDFSTRNVYFVQSEVEMPDRRNHPEYMPDIIKDNFIHAVARDDKRFTNKNLSSKTHASSLYGLYTPSCL